MMTDVIERYLYDVSRRLPEREREEVCNELRANIYDMLPENAGDEEIRAVITELGPPSALAGKYTTKQRYLISPEVYDLYIATLKTVLPIVGAVMLIIGMLANSADIIRSAATAIKPFVKDIIRTLLNGVEMAVSATIQTAIWTTVGFVIYERANSKGDVKRAWSPESLPALPIKGKGRIPLSDGISGLVVTVVLCSLGILICSEVIPSTIITVSAFNIHASISDIFSRGFLQDCIPAFLAMMLIGSAEYIVKILVRRWTGVVCAAAVASNLSCMGIMLFLLTRPYILGDALIDYMQSSRLSFFRFGATPSLVAIGSIIVLSSVGSCVAAIVRTVRSADRISVNI